MFPQSFDAEELKFVGRAAEAPIATSRVRDALSVGFANVNVDMIYGLRGQRLDAFMYSLGCAAG